MSDTTRSAKQLIAAALERAPDNNYEAAELLGVSEGTIRRWREGRVPDQLRADTRRALEAYLRGGTVEGRDGADGKAKEPKPPQPETLEWIPRLLEQILSDPTYSATEKTRLMAEVNAAGMRFWAVSAEWAAGQRGIAMQTAEVASNDRGVMLQRAGRELLKAPREKFRRVPRREEREEAEKGKKRA